ncbi:DNA adenine methylase [uncultured Metabacillus sp.]|uniref:DNA adenine methylase n=1 Tax=uncultured Metabacillus sp. TaxID=2860135 RepID=UPI0026305910|nr:DNA adenine methylase [uncultured Metabacillus sp.]
MIDIRYFGGKARIAKPIVEYLKSIREEGQPYIEPFVGGGWVMSLMDGERIACDKHTYLIEMYKAMQNGWIPPTNLTKEEYEYIKNNRDEKPYLTGFVGFGCSFAGKWFGGFASSKDRNYCLNAHNSIMKKMETMKDVKFYDCDYKEINPKGLLVYCDPPYQGTTQYGLVGNFDSNEFWDVVREWSKENMVVVSEYNAPEDFVEVWSKDVKTDIRNKDNKKEQRIEKLFLHKSNLKQIIHNETA